VSRRQDFRLVVVRGDGTRILRVTFGRRFLVAVAASVFLVSGLVSAVAMDWLELRRITRDLRPRVPEILEHRATIERLYGRIGELRREVEGWHTIHSRLFDAFGPDGGPGTRGIGGRATPVERLPDRLSPHDELTRLADGLAEETRALRMLDMLMARVGKMLAAVPNRWPVRGAVNSEFGARVSPWSRDGEFHAGMDIRAERGTLVRAPASGVVSLAGPNAEYGLSVMLDHGNDIRSLYAHLSKVSVKLGERVERGAEIGLTGNTGRSSGPHLHYEILVKGQPVNPRTYLWE
jgi:murein DD-endopeptidase MepM/ murein hydrolase activator NlpD